MCSRKEIVTILKMHSKVKTIRSNELLGNGNVKYFWKPQPQGMWNRCTRFPLKLYTKLNMHKLWYKESLQPLENRTFRNPNPEKRGSIEWRSPDLIDDIIDIPIGTLSWLYKL